jgi:hypothetical protein
MTDEAGDDGPLDQFRAAGGVCRVASPVRKAGPVKPAGAKVLAGNEGAIAGLGRRQGALALVVWVEYPGIKEGLAAMGWGQVFRFAAE